MITATARPATRKEKIDIDRVTQWGIGLCVTGLLISALCLHLSSRAAVSLSPPAELLLDLAILAGMTLFAMGVFGIVLGSRNWRGYFEAGLREVLLEPHYLESLSPEGRRDHLIEILKAEHGDRDIGREGRLLRYCLDHVHKYLAHPYWENVQLRISVEAADTLMLKVTERLDYTRRRTNRGDQGRVLWQASVNEVVSVQNFRIKLHWPREHPESSRKLEIGLEEIDSERLADGSRRFEHDLGDLGSLDGLQVRVEAVYLVHSASFHSWRTAVPIRDLEVEISYPRDFDLQFFPCVLGHDGATLRHDPGLSCARLDSWALPGSGFAWKLVPRYLPDEVQIGTQGGGSTLEDIVADGAD